MIYVTKYGASMASYRPSEVEVARAERQEQIIIKETAMEVAVQKVEELIKGARGQAARVTTQNEAFSMLFDAISCRFMADFMPIVAYLRREKM